jgi:hypothetical protein
MMRSRVPELDKVKPDTPLRLDIAATLAYPDGSMTASGLRKEAGRGRLVVERVAGKDYTTLASIQRMRELCRVNPKVPDSGSNPEDKTKTAQFGSEQFGSSATERASSARARLQKIARVPSKRCAIISPTNTNQTEPAVVVPIKS